MPIQFVCRWCGRESKIDRFRSRYSKICMDCYKEHTHKKARQPNSKFLRLEYTARKLGVEMDITRKDYLLFQDCDCVYCGLPVTGRSSVDAQKNTGSGLDRVDPKKGYTLDNVVPSCFLCNRTKSDWFTHEEMKVIGRAIREVIDTRPSR